MTYTNLTTSLLELHKSNQIVARIGYLALIPAGTMTVILDTIMGLGAMLASLCVAGACDPLLRFAHNHLGSCHLIVLLPLKNLLLLINPGAERSVPGESDPTNDSLLAYTIAQPFVDFADGCKVSKNILIRHVASRLVYAFSLITFLVARILDALVGSVAALGALCTRGTNKKINDIAWGGLQFPAIIYDVPFCVIKVLNPWAGH